MQDLNDLYYFVQAVDHAGFSPAARVLGIPKSKISRRIAVLEERLGVRLIHRSTRQFQLTEIGSSYYEHCKAMLIQAEAAQEVIDVSQAEPCGLIKVSCPIAMLNMNIAQMLSDFMALYPKLKVQLLATNRKVDVVAEAIDIAIRVRPAPLQSTDLILRVLAERAHSLVASPDLLAQFPGIENPSDLASIPSLALGEINQNYQWQLQGPDTTQALINHEPRLITTDMLTLKHAAIAGIGVVQLPLMMIQEQLNNGALIRVLPQWQPKDEIIHAVFASRRGLLPSVRLFIDYLVASFKQIDKELFHK